MLDTPTVTLIFIEGKDGQNKANSNMDLIMVATATYKYLGQRKEKRGCIKRLRERKKDR